jgi:hypothetical protein
MAGSWKCHHLHLKTAVVVQQIGSLLTAVAVNNEGAPASGRGAGARLCLFFFVAVSVHLCALPSLHCNTSTQPVPSLGSPRSRGSYAAPQVAPIAAGRCLVLMLHSRVLCHCCGGSWWWWWCRCRRGRRACCRWALLCGYIPVPPLSLSWCKAGDEEGPAR